MDINVFVSKEMRENTLVVPLTETDVFVVDPAADFDLNGKNPVAVVLTHGHFDHVAKLSAFCKQNSAVPVLIHEADAKYLGKNAAEAQSKILDDCGATGLASEFRQLPEATAFLSEGQILSEAIHTESQSVQNALSHWLVIHTPGHSAGSICLMNQTEHILISGDTLFYCGYGRTDFFDGNYNDMLGSLRRLYSLPDDTLVYPGHDLTGFALGENKY